MPSAWAVPCKGVLLIRGLPNNIKGEPTDFTVVAEPRGDVAILHLAERLDTPDKYRRCKGVLAKCGFKWAKAQRNGRTKRYRVDG